MPIPPERLAIKALLALEEISRGAERGPQCPPLAVRFALAYLYAVGGGNRGPYDAFWKALKSGGDSHPEAIQRNALASAALEAIYRDHGTRRPIEMMFYGLAKNRQAEKVAGDMDQSSVD